VLLGKMKKEDSRGLRRHYKGRNYVPKFQGNLHRSKHLKRQKKHAFMHLEQSHMHPGMDVGAWSMKLQGTCTMDIKWCSRCPIAV